VQRILNEIQKKESNEADRTRQAVGNPGEGGEGGGKDRGDTTKEDERDSSVYIEKCH
jgi:hypothetical protein